jgi:hypothetical protein
MKKSLYISLISAAVAASAPLASAQDLKKDVVIERDVEPAVRAATRLSTVSPSIYAPTVEKRKLLLSEYAGTGKLNCKLPLLEPAAYADTFAVSPYRGYAGIGYFPGFNLGASAGYRFINTPATRLGAWLQYDGNSYNSKRDIVTPSGIEGYTKDKLTRHTFNIGADFEQESRYGTLGLDFGYAHNYVTQPNVAEDFKQNTNKIDFAIGWNAKSRNLPWHLGISLDYFGFTKAMPEDAIVPGKTYETKAANEFIFGINGGIDKRFGESSIGVDLDARFQNLNNMSSLVPLWDDADYSPSAVYTNYLGKKTLGITSLTPHYTYNNGTFSANLGVKVDISTGNNYGGVYFSPDVKLVYAPTSQVAVYAKVDGGKELTELSELFDDSQFMSSAFTYERGKVPYDAKLGINVGPAAGFTGELWVGYSKASNWYMPASYQGTEFFMAGSVKGFRYGARLGWQYNDIVKIFAQAEGAQSGEGKGYYKWRDNAKWAIDAGITVTPIKPLDVTVDWNLRTSRYLYEVEPAVTFLGSIPFGYWQAEKFSLGNANSLNIKALYRINDAWSAFVNVENLLCKHWLLTTEFESQGIHGLFGVTYKF